MGPGPTPTTEDLSLAWWMVDNYDSYQTIMNKYVSDSVAGNGILLRPEAEDRPLRWRLGGWQAYGGWGEECGVPQGAYSDGEWTHVICTYDSAADTATIYINGVVPENTANPQWNPKTGIAGPNGYCEGVNDPTQDLLIVGQQELYGGILDEVAIWDHPLSPAEALNVFEKGPQESDKRMAGRPTPGDEAGDIPRDLTLTWAPGESSVTRDVFLGTTLEDANSASITNPLGATVGQDLSGTEWNPGRLEFGQTYFWRVDEANGAPDNTVFKGKVWSFTTEPYAYAVEIAAVTASSQQSDTMGPEKTIDGSGLDELDQHSTSDVDMWLTGGDASPWIQFEFDKANSIHEMWVWNSNQVIEQALGLGAKDVTIEISTDGDTWTALEGEFQFTQASGTAGYAHNTVVELGGALAKYVKLTVNSSYGPLPQVGLSEVRFFSVPVFARELSPANGSAGVDPAALLTWRAGREAGSHDVYISTDEQAVIDGTAPVETVADASYMASLDLNQTYYWKVNEVNTLEDPATWEGDILSFSTVSSWSVDDFESYANTSPDRPFQTWVDGVGYSADEFFPVAYGGNGTGAAIGHDIWSLSSPYFDGKIMETTNTIPGSGQSMPFYYNNTGGVASQTERTFAVPQDWTIGGAQTLSISFNGQAGNTGTMFIMINNVKLTYQRDNGNISRGVWQAWNIDLAGVNTTLSSITKLTLGVEGAGASGMILFDDIRLFPEAGEVLTPQDPGTNGLVGAWSFDEGSGTVAADGSGNGRNGTVIDALWGTGIAGSALDFNGTSAYVNIDGFKGINAVDGVQQPFTISNWIKTTSGEGEMVTWGTSAGQQRLTWRINANTLRTEHAAGNLRGNTPVNDDEWHHVALVVTEGAGLTVPATQIILDGLADGTFSGTGTTYNLTPDVDVRIGMGGPTGGRFFTGLIDEVKLYDRALTGEELLWLAGWTDSIDKPF